MTDLLRVVVLPSIGLDCTNTCNHVVDKFHALIISQRLRLLQLFLQSRGAHLEEVGNDPEPSHDHRVLPAGDLPHEQVACDVDKGRSKAKRCNSKGPFECENVRADQIDKLPRISLS